MSSSPFYINTKGTCLLCRRHCSGSSSHDKESKASSSCNNDAAFKMLLRYLKVDQRNLVHFSSSVLSSSSECSLDTWDFSVTLCDECSSVANDFLELFQAYEGIRIQMDLCVGQLQQFMEKGDKDRNLISEYEKRISARNVGDLLDASIAESLRKETMRKVSQNVKFSMPRITLKEWSEPHKNINERRKPPENNALAPFTSENTESKTKLNDEGEIDEALNENELLFCTEDDSMDSFCSIEAAEVEEVAAPLTTVPDFVNNENEVEIPKMSESVEQVETCVYCGEGYSLKCALDTHKLSKHSFLFLTDTARLPPHVSEPRLESALDAAFAQVKYPSLNCPFCSFGGSVLKKDEMRAHFLRMHLNRITEDIDKHPPAEDSTLELHPDKALQPVEIHGNTSKSSRKQISNQRLKCTYCGINFSQTSDLRRHQYNKHAKSILSYEGRLPSSVSEQQLETALAVTLTGISGKGAKCPVCGVGSSASNMYHLRAHILHHHLGHVLEKVVEGSSSDTVVVSTTIPRYKCNSCGKLLLSRRALRKHYLRLHLGSQDQNVRRCDICQQSFSCQPSLRRHHIRSHPVATFHHRLPLGVADQEFHQAVSIIVGEKYNENFLKYGVIRRKVHGTGERYVCTLCGKRWRNITDLKSHIPRAHLDEVVRVLGKLGAESGVKMEVINAKQECSVVGDIHPLFDLGCGEL